MPAEMALPVPFLGLAFSFRDQKFFIHTQMGARDAPFLREARKKLVSGWVNRSKIRSDGHRHFWLVICCFSEVRTAGIQPFESPWPFDEAGAPFIH